MDMETLRGRVSSEYQIHLDRILAMCNAPYAVDNGIELVSISPECARMRKEVRPEDLNSHGVVHGAVTFGIIDHTFAIAANVRGDGVGQSCNIIYHRPCKGPIIETECRPVNESRHLVIFDVRIMSEGKLMVSATCTGFKYSQECGK